jgi:hypothetical protein
MEIMAENTLLQTEGSDLQKKTRSIFKDLKYGEFLLTFPNPFFRYQIKDKIVYLHNLHKAKPATQKSMPKEKMIKKWFKELNKYEGMDITYEELTKYLEQHLKRHQKGEDIGENSEDEEEKVLNQKIKYRKDQEDGKDGEAWMMLGTAMKIYDECLGKGRGGFSTSGLGDHKYGLKELNR